MIGHRPVQLEPGNDEQVHETITRAVAEWGAIRIQGGDTLAGMGLPLARDHAVISTRKLRHVIKHEFSDLVASVQSGITLRALRNALCEHAQFLPLDAPRSQQATVGGTLAAGWLGPRRHFYGRPRDYVIGTKMALADGSIASAGGMVVKNVTGYDMSKLYIGSFGTLGLLLSANFKTLPMPAGARLFAAKLPENTWQRTLGHLLDLAIQPSAALWVHGFSSVVEGDDGLDGRIIVLLEGSITLLDRATRDLRAALGRAGVPETHVIEDGALERFDRTLDAYVACIGERSITYRLFDLPEQIGENVRFIYELARAHQLTSEAIADVMNGDVAVRVSAKDAQAFSERIETFDDELHARMPRAIIIAGESPIRASLSVWGQAPPAIEKMRDLKMAFDPRGVFNPGRFVGDI